MKRALIFLNGDLSNVQRAKTYLKNTDLIIAADGGAEFVLKLGMIPHVIIGDNDSLSKKTQSQLANQPIEWITFPKEKDATDSELALQHAIENDFKEILLFGVLGTRSDHFLTNIFALTNHAKKGITLKIIEGNQEMQVIHDAIILRGKVGDLVSLIPITGDARGVSTQNLQYPLTNETLFFGSSRGISNVMTDRTAKVNLSKGLLLVIQSFTEINQPF
jgi:thiamine pyrophosphokinase